MVQLIVEKIHQETDKFYTTIFKKSKFFEVVTCVLKDRQLLWALT